MPAQPLPYIRIEEYIALEKASDARYEWHDGEIVLMSGGSLNHEMIAANITRYLGNRLAGRNCRAFSGGMPLDVPAVKPYRYADASVACGKAEITKYQGIDRLANPILIVEVLSPTTASYDRKDKFEEYRSIPTFSAYLLVAQDRPHIVYRFKDEAGVWNEIAFKTLEDVISVPSVNVELPLSEIYEDVIF